MKWSLTVFLLTGLCALTHCRPHRYHFIRTATTWLKAQMYCRELHTDLATVYDIEDMNRVVNTAQDATGGFKDRAWIGLYENLTNWRWSRSDQRRGPFSDEEGDDFRGWDVSQPDNFLGDEMCVNMGSAGGWEDSPCFLQNPFICYNETANNSRQFTVIEKKMSWSDAQLYCRDRYTDLASVRNEEENRKIQRLTKESSTWIGLFRTREWSDQSDSTYRYWREGQPDHVGRELSCTATDLGNAGLWSDEDCSKQLSFICYEENDFSTTSTAATSATTSTAEENSAGTVFTSSEQLSTQQKDQTTSVPDQAANSLPSTSSTSTVNPSAETVTEIESTTGRVSTEMTSTEQPSSPEVDLTNETPSSPPSSTTSTPVTQSEISPSRIPPTSTERWFSTSELHQTTSVTDESKPVFSTADDATAAPSTNVYFTTDITSSELPPVSENETVLSATTTEGGSSSTESPGERSDTSLLIPAS
ncbi:cell wall protein IFF6-like [Stegastes partitus]|uniref:Cell wall protein IFF6-like n=1 Tax=Stegastes partitus TaxID=144197 RepID=A0A9Y4MZL2_9TELE|nr:PREDICTED: cell wall protein IFF6-like [Stegastes partitus]